MVFLTAQLWLRNRITDRYWRVQEVLKHARHFRGRKNRCYRLAVRAVTRAFVQCTRARRLKKRNLRTVSAARSASPRCPSPPEPAGPRGRRCTAPGEPLLCTRFARSPVGTDWARCGVRVSGARGWQRVRRGSLTRNLLDRCTQNFPSPASPAALRSLAAPGADAAAPSSWPFSRPLPPPLQAFTSLKLPPGPLLRPELCLPQNLLLIFVSSLGA
uniref:Mitochondrial ribosomal protein L20 n=1 Tax=Monodon monoceros TaxID=40151 RepID=A0A8C6F824_MONMO